MKLFLTNANDLQLNVVVREQGEPSRKSNELFSHMWSKNAVISQHHMYHDQMNN